MSSNFEVTQGWGYVVAGYFLIEQSLKGLLHVRGKEEVPKTHSLSELFDLLGGGDQETLREYYADYPTTIEGKLDADALPFKTLDAFLVNLDGNQHGGHMGSLDWRYFPIAKPKSQKMPIVAIDLLHEIAYGCIRIISYADNGHFEPRKHTRSWRWRSERDRKYNDWLSVRTMKGGLHDPGDRLEILWGPDYRGRCDVLYFKGGSMYPYFIPIPETWFPVVDKRQEVADFDAEEGFRSVGVEECRR